MEFSEVDIRNGILVKWHLVKQNFSETEFSEMEFSEWSLVNGVQ